MMTVKTGVSAALLVFVAAAVVTIAVRGRGGEMPADDSTTSAEAPADGVQAYYFFGDTRCATCRKLEAYAEEALASTEVPLVALNVDQPANRHFVDDFQLTSKALVLVEYEDGQVTRWQDLKLIWQLVDEHEGYLAYVRQQTADFVAAS